MIKLFVLEENILVPTTTRLVQVFGMFTTIFSLVCSLWYVCRYMCTFAFALVWTLGRRRNGALPFSTQVAKVTCKCPFSSGGSLETKRPYVCQSSFILPVSNEMLFPSAARQDPEAAPSLAADAVPSFAASPGLSFPLQGAASFTLPCFTFLRIAICVCLVQA